MLSGHLNAARRAQNPIPQPSYCFADVPQASPTLPGSTLQRVVDRDQFHTCMSEILLLCKESMRRRRRCRPRPGPSDVLSHNGGVLAEQQGTTLPPQTTLITTSNNSSKPLSLEYLADRIDIDDPIFGCVVRTHNEIKSSSSTWKCGMLQGFITVRTFTTSWQRSFRWDSTMEEAFECDDTEMCQDRLNGIRKWDQNDELARALQSTVRFGDIYNEGIVWPHIADISLLSALGCGRKIWNVKEECDVIDDGSDPTETKSLALRRSYGVSSGKLIKPSVERKKKRSSFELPPLPSMYRSSERNVKGTVKLIGRNLYEDGIDYTLTIKKPRGRPKGSKNSPKSSPTSEIQSIASCDNIMDRTSYPALSNCASPRSIIASSPKVSIVSASKQAMRNRNEKF